MLIEAAAVHPVLYGESQCLVKPWVKSFSIPLVGSPQYQHMHHRAALKGETPDSLPESRWEEPQSEGCQGRETRP